MPSCAAAYVAQQQQQQRLAWRMLRRGLAKPPVASGTRESRGSNPCRAHAPPETAGMKHLNVPPHPSCCTTPRPLLQPLLRQRLYARTRCSSLASRLHRRVLGPHGHLFSAAHSSVSSELPRPNRISKACLSLKDWPWSYWSTIPLLRYETAGPQRALLYSSSASGRTRPLLNPHTKQMNLSPPFLAVRSDAQVAVDFGGVYLIDCETSEESFITMSSFRGSRERPAGRNLKPPRGASAHRVT